LKPFRLRFPTPLKVTCELNARVIKPETLEYPPVCPCCGQELSLHQPDENLPTQLLATCDDCSRWFSLIECSDDGSEILMVELPGRSMIEEIVLKLSLNR
jgi:hypothetical protein